LSRAFQNERLAVRIGFPCFQIVDNHSFHNILLFEYGCKYTFFPMNFQIKSTLFPMNFKRNPTLFPTNLKRNRNGEF
jgi:hypothetical protein